MQARTTIKIAIRFRIGALHDGLRELTAGLKPGEWVLVSGLQQVRPGLTVEPKLVDMPNGSQQS